MDDPCPRTVPNYYTTTLHLITVISFPINLTAYWLVWFQSPGMQGYKYCLAYTQVASLLTEVYMSWICPAFYFFPMIGGYNNGDFFSQFISPHLSMSIWVGIFCSVLSSNLCCFVYRHKAAAEISQTYSSKHYIKKFALTINHILPFFASISLYFSNLTYEQKYEHLSQYYPQCLHWLASDRFEVYAPDVNKMFYVMGIGTLVVVFVTVWYCFTLGVHTMIILRRLRHHMSPATYQMHRAAITSLTMQLALPGALIVIPKNIILYIVVTDSIHSQEIATNMTFLISSHSMFQSMTMILANSNYRKIIKDKIRTVLRLPVDSSGSSVEPSDNLQPTVMNA